MLAAAKRTIITPINNLFRKKRSPDDLRAIRDERAAELELARGRLSRSYEARDAAAIEGSDLLDASEAEMRAAEDRVESLTDLSRCGPMFCVIQSQLASWRSRSSAKASAFIHFSKSSRHRFPPPITISLRNFAAAPTRCFRATRRPHFRRQK
jgi:hypothetical protein